MVCCIRFNLLKVETQWSPIHFCALFYQKQLISHKISTSWFPLIFLFVMISFFGIYYQYVFYTLSNKSVCFIITTLFALKTLTIMLTLKKFCFQGFYFIFDCFWTHIFITWGFFTVYAISILQYFILDGYSFF